MAAKRKKQEYMGNPNLPTADAVFEYTPEMVMEMEKCKGSLLYFASNYFYIIDPDEGKKVIPLFDYQQRLLKSFDEHRFNIVLSSRQSGKALALDTPINTPNGWTTMGELKDGDAVYGIDGKSCKVVKAHEILHDRKCYKITFDNGEEIVADADHNWFVQSSTERKSKKNGSVKTTKEILRNYTNKSGEPNYRIPSCVNGLENDEKEFTLPPYILGLWLGDGATDGSRITVGKRDIKETIKLLEEHCQYHLNVQFYENKNIYSINLKKDEESGKFGSLHKELRNLDLLGNKHIPSQYFLGSRNQRLELLKGLIDSDGYVDKRGNCNFYNTNLKLCDQVKELIESLGYKTTKFIKIPTLNGLECSPCGVLEFRPREEVCKLSFKKNRIVVNKLSIPDSNKRNQWHYIKKIEEIPSVPVRCITVDSADSLFLCGKTNIPTHNTTVATALALHEACFKDHKNIVIVANKEETAKNIFKRVRLAYLELPNWLKPGIKKWGDTGLELANGSTIEISTTTGNAARGKTINLLLLDELAFIEPESIVEDFWRSVYPTISRAKTSRILITSTPNGVGNLFHRLYIGATKKENRFHYERIDWWEVPGRDNEWKQEQIKDLGSYESFAQEYGNEFNDNSQTSIDEELFDKLKQECKEPLHILKDGAYKIWEEYDQEKIYAIGGDVSEGVGLDSSVLEIFDITNPKEIVQVGEYVNNKIGPSEFTNVIAEICGHWGNPLLLIERNNQGTGVCDRLANEFMYQNLVSWGAKEAHKNKQNGMISHINTKYKAVLNMRYFVNESKSVTFRSIDSLKEFKTFVRYPNGSWKAKGGEHDDRVMATVWMLMSLYNDIAELYFEIEELDDCDRPLVIKPIDQGLFKYKSATSIYTNEEVAKIEHSNLAPMLFGGEGSMAASDMADLEAQGWFLPQGSINSNPDRNISYEQWDAMNKYFG